MSIKYPVPKKVLFDLVSIPSINPKLPGSIYGDNESGVASYVSEFFKAFRIDFYLQEVAPGRYNVIGHIERGKMADDKIILLSAHMDTYPSSYECKRDMVPRIENNWLVGRGSADAKGSLAAMLCAGVNSLKSENRRETYIVASVDEEHGLTGAKKLVEFGISPELAITGEPTQLIPIVGQKGILRASIIISGEAGHAAYPPASNSVYGLAKILDLIEKYNQVLQMNSRVEGLSPASIVPTVIGSNGTMNSLSTESTIFFDARILPGTQCRDFMRDLNEYLSINLPDDLIFHIESPCFESPPNLCSLESPIVSELCQIIQKNNPTCVPAYFSYGSEAGVYSKIAKNSVVFGPGNPKYSHGPGEKIDIKELNEGERIYYQIIVSKE